MLRLISVLPSCHLEFNTHINELKNQMKLRACSNSFKGTSSSKNKIGIEMPKAFVVRMTIQGRTTLYCNPVISVAPMILFNAG